MVAQYYLRPGALASLQDARARYLAEKASDTSDLKFHIMIGQEIQGDEGVSYSCEMQKGDWVIHHLDVFRSATIDVLRNPRDLKRMLGQRIDMLLLSLRFGWKERGWKEWSIDGVHPIPKSDLSFLGVLVLDGRPDPDISIKSGFFSGISTLIEELDTDADLDGDPQRILLYSQIAQLPPIDGSICTMDDATFLPSRIKRSLGDFIIFDMNIPLAARLHQRQALRMISIPELGDTALLQWMDKATTKPRMVEETPVLNKDESDLINRMDDFDELIFLSENKTSVEGAIKRHQESLSSLSVETALLKSSVDAFRHHRRPKDAKPDEQMYDRVNRSTLLTNCIRQKPQANINRDQLDDVQNLNDNFD